MESAFNRTQPGSRIKSGTTRVLVGYPQVLVALFVIMYYYTSTYDFRDIKIYIQTRHRTNCHDQRMDVHTAPEIGQAYRGYISKDRVGDEHSLSLHYAASRTFFQDVR